MTLGCLSLPIYSSRQLLETPRGQAILLPDLLFLNIDLMVLACGHILGMPSLLKAGNTLAFIVAY